MLRKKQPPRRGKPGQRYPLKQMAKAYEQTGRMPAMGLGTSAPMRQMRQQVMNQAAIDRAKPRTYKKGGKVKKSGMAKVHKGERVLTAKQDKKFERAKKKYFGM